MKKNKFYYAVNFVFIGIAFLFVAFSGFFKIGSFDFSQICLLVFLIVTIHLLKFIRIFLLLLEEKLSMKNFLNTYIKSTFVSIALPFKIGELFKIYSYGHDIESYKKGFISVVIEKFFDIAIVCIVFIITSIISSTSLPAFSWILIILIVISLFFYFSFPGIYYYMNRFLISKNRSKNGVRALKFLEKLNDFYLDTKKMLRGRWFIILSLSVFAWGIEFFLVYLIFNFSKSSLAVNDIANYISDSFFGVQNSALIQYTVLCSIVFLVILIFTYATKYSRIARKKAHYKV